MKFLSDIEVEQGTDATFVDNAKALFGNSSDLQIYHDGSNSYIKDVGTGILNLQGSAEVLIAGANGQVGVQFIENGKVGLSYANGEKLATTSTGVTVTGDLTISKSTPNLIFNNLGGGGIDASLTAAAANFTLSTSSITALTIALTNGNATFAGDVIVSGGDISLGGTGRIQGIDSVLATTDAVNKAYVDAVNVGVTQITAGTNITISPVGGTGNVTINASGGGGSGTIGGSITATQVAFGATTTDEITSDSTLFYSSLNGLTIGDAAINGSNAILNLNKGEGGTGRIVMKKLGVSKFDLKLDGSEDAYITAVNTLTITTTQPSGVTKDIILNPTGNVGVGDTSPSSKLSVAGGIQMANDGETSNTNSDKAGTLRYREVTNIGTPKASNSYIDMYMRTGDSTYGWVNIVTSNW